MQKKRAPIKPKREREDESTSNAQRAPDDRTGRIQPKKTAAPLRFSGRVCSNRPARARGGAPEALRLVAYESEGGHAPRDPSALQVYLLKESKSYRLLV